MERELEPLLTQHEVLRLTGFRSRTTLYRKTRNGLFPRPVMVGSSQIRWRVADVDAWMRSLPERPF